MITQLIEAIFLGIIQGVTEFLPVSSTGHLIIFEKLLGISQEKFGLSFDAALHLGTAAAVFWFFSHKWIKIIKGEDKKLGILLIAATIPGAIFGMLLESKVETAFRSPVLVAMALVAGSIILFFAEKLGKQIKKLKDINFTSSSAIGFSQAVALIPGISRSGITISTGMFFSQTRQSAAEFAFLMSGPIILGAGGKKLLETMYLFAKGSLTAADLLFFAAGIIASAVAGLITIKFLMNYLSKKSMNIFIIYRLLLAFSIFIFLR